MEQSGDEYSLEDTCGDNEGRHEEATTSKANFNDPNQTSLYVNELKSLDFNSADDVRLVNN